MHRVQTTPHTFKLTSRCSNDTHQTPSGRCNVAFKMFRVLVVRALFTRRLNKLVPAGGAAEAAGPLRGR